MTAMRLCRRESQPRPQTVLYFARPEMSPASGVA